MPWKSHDCDLTMRLLKDPYSPTEEVICTAGRLSSGTCSCPRCLLVSPRREGHTLGVTGNLPSSCLRHVTGDGLSLQFFFWREEKKKKAVSPDWHLLCTKAASSTCSPGIELWQGKRTQRCKWGEVRLAETQTLCFLPLRCGGRAGSSATGRLCCWFLCPLSPQVRAGGLPMGPAPFCLPTLPGPFLCGGTCDEQRDPFWPELTWKRQWSPQNDRWGKERRWKKKKEEKLLGCCRNCAWPLVMSREGFEAFPVLHSHTGGQTAGKFPQDIKP